MTRRMIFRYVTTSVVSTAVDFSVFLLAGWCFSRLPGGFAALLSASSGAVASWNLNRLWVFPDSKVNAWTSGGRFAAGVIMYIILNGLIVGFLCDFWRLPRLAGRCIAATSVGVLLFWYNRKIVFQA